ncbi:pentatricopeptide repeat-containing protein At2g01390 [Arachis duranensis]|uniref:Pentatricopeptide repeat-containing protein At2g01390 n=1 Tax=Arachis duranensis TaxID=130453 RepID=A0A6P4E2N6_ARADU|nr:pentatricopeptide repeat-containing protein At2g01390 [Arachis duranensis]
MLRTWKLRGFLIRKFAPSANYIYMHSLHQLQQNKKEKEKNKNKNTNKKEEDSHCDPKEYMRSVIGNIYKTLKYSTWDSAQKELENLPLRWDSYTVNQVLKSHPPMEKAWLFFNWASKLTCFKHDQYTYTTMIDIFGEAGRISSMKQVFKQMQDNDVNIDSITYTCMMHWLSNSGDIDAAMELWKEMKSKDCCYPTVVSYTAYIKILFDHGRVKEATCVYKEMIESGCAPNCYTYTILMEYLVGSGKCKDALEIFEKMQEAGVQPDKAACNILIERCAKIGGIMFMTHILRYMKENRLVLRYPVFVEALKALKVAGESDALIRQVNPQFYIDSSTIRKDDDCFTVDVDKELLFVLLRKRNLVAIDHLLAGMMDKKIPLDHKGISSIIEVNCSHCRPEGALLAFKYSVKMGIYMERQGYLSLIGLLIRSNMFSQLVEAVEEMSRAGHSLGIYLASILIYRLGCAKKPAYAVTIFNLLPDNHKCTATYTALISAYFASRRVNKALDIHKSMCAKGFLTVLGTYNVLVAGLERNGRNSEAEFYRKAKKKCLHTNAGSEERVCIEEKICNLLFAVDLVH